MFTASDTKYMTLALELAAKAKGNTSPNPMVGAVIVKDDQIIGQGYHRKAGTHHAEIHALNQAGRQAENATLYVTLEPCNHQGKTPACSTRIIKEKIKKVIIAMKDPNPMINGSSIVLLRENGIEVSHGLLEEKARQLNKIFIKYITTGLPFLTIKSAITLDGKICTKTGDSKWISNSLSRAYVHRQRYYHDAVMVGINTVIKDNPNLSCRISDQEIIYPWRIITDSQLKINASANVLLDPQIEKVIIATTTRAPEKKIIDFKKKGIKIIQTGDDQVDLKQLLIHMAKLEISSILVEGGGEINASLIDNRLVDKILLFISPKIIGGRDARTFVEGKGVEQMNQAFLFKLKQIKQFTDDIMLEYEPRQ